MKRILLILITLLSAQALQALDVAGLESAFAKRREVIDQKKTDAINRLSQGYLQALAKLATQFQKAGDLDRYELIGAEKKRIENKEWPLPDLPEKISRGTRNLRQVYRKTYLNHNLEWATATTSAATKMLRLLEKKKSDLTKEGQLAEARKAQALIEELKNDVEISKARDLSSRLSETGKAKPAFVIRRGGDDLEVLVRYDETGKLSYDSPVENVVEQTGVVKDKGETVAKTLGAFLGAEGYPSVGYLLLDIPASKRWEFSELVGCSLKKNQEAEGTKGDALVISPRAKNAYARIKGVLVPSDGSLTHRVTTTYIVPSENKLVDGFNLQHGGAQGTKIGAPFQTIGKWVTETREALASTDSDILTIYFRGPSFSQLPMAAGDKIMISNFRVEISRFPAYIVESFGEDGQEKDKFTKRSAQKILARNGKLIAATQ